jgi:hypothetical protein
MLLGYSKLAFAEFYFGFDLNAMTPNNKLVTRLAPGGQASLNLGYAGKESHGVRLSLAYREHPTLKLKGTAAESIEGRYRHTQIYLMYEYFFWKTAANDGFKLFFVSFGPGTVAWQASAKNLESGEEKTGNGEAQGLSFKLGRKSDYLKGMDSAYFLMGEYTDSTITGTAFGVGYEWML